MLSENGAYAFAKSIDHVSLRSPRRLTWVETFRHSKSILYHYLVDCLSKWIGNYGYIL